MLRIIMQTAPEGRFLTRYFLEESYRFFWVTKWRKLSTLYISPYEGDIGGVKYKTFFFENLDDIKSFRDKILSNKSNGFLKQAPLESPNEWVYYIEERRWIEYAIEGIRPISCTYYKNKKDMENYLQSITSPKITNSIVE